MPIRTEEDILLVLEWLSEEFKVPVPEVKVFLYINRDAFDYLEEIEKRRMFDEWQLEDEFAEAEWPYSQGYTPSLMGRYLREPTPTILLFPAAFEDNELEDTVLHEFAHHLRLQPVNAEPDSDAHDKIFWFHFNAVRRVAARWGIKGNPQT